MLGMANRYTQIPLANLPLGKEGKIIDINAGRGLERRLISMGIGPGKKVKRLMSISRSPILIGIDMMRIAMGYGIANKIIVEYDEEKRENGNF